MTKIAQYHRQIAQLHNQIAGELGSSNPTPQPEPEKPKPTPQPNPEGTQVLIMAMDSPNMDVKLNGTWHNLSNNSDWNASMVGKSHKGKIIHLNTDLRQLEFRPEQLQVDGLNLWEFGSFNFKILCRHPDSNLSAPAWASSGGVNFWGHSHCGGRIISAGGFNNTVDLNKHFYKYNVPQHYNASGKMAIFLNGYGNNHMAFEPYGDNKW